MNTNTYFLVILIQSLMPLIVIVIKYLYNQWAIKAAPEALFHKAMSDQIDKILASREPTDLWVSWSTDLDINTIKDGAMKRQEYRTLIDCRNKHYRAYIKSPAFNYILKQQRIKDTLEKFELKYMMETKVQ